MYYHFYLSPFIFSCKESFNSSSFLKFEILIAWASSPLGYAYYILAKAMWKHAYITMFPHFEDKLLISLGKKKCGNMPI